jgi:ribosomal protein S5
VSEAIAEEPITSSNTKAKQPNKGGVVAMKRSSCSGLRKKHMRIDLNNRDRGLGIVVGPKWQKIVVCRGLGNISFSGVR